MIYTVFGISSSSVFLMEFNGLDDASDMALDLSATGYSIVKITYRKT